jgi:hypothetical protein
VAQQWVNSAFYSHPNIDGMFLAAPDGALLGSIPTTPELVGKDFGANYWREEAAASDQPIVSSVHPRFSDGRLVTDVVALFGEPDGQFLGFVGDSVLWNELEAIVEHRISDRFVSRSSTKRGRALRQ